MGEIIAGLVLTGISFIYSVYCKCKEGVESSIKNTLVENGVIEHYVRNYESATVNTETNVVHFKGVTTAQISPNMDLSNYGDFPVFKWTMKSMFSWVPGINKADIENESMDYVSLLDKEDKFSDIDSINSMQILDDAIVNDVDTEKVLKPETVKDTPTKVILPSKAIDYIADDGIDCEDTNCTDGIYNKILGADVDDHIMVSPAA